MSKASDAFIKRVQDNRGRIKSKKYIDMLHSIFKRGSKASLDQAESRKLVGIAFIASVVEQLDKTTQNNYWKEFMTKPSQDITTAKLLLADYVIAKGDK